MTEKSTESYRFTGGWHFFVFYFNREDPRIIVPKRIRSMGWTINLARPMAIPLTLIIIAVVLAPFKALEYYNINSGGAYILTFIAVLISLVTFCSWMANPGRFGNKQNKTEPEH